MQRTKGLTFAGIFLLLMTFLNLIPALNVAVSGAPDSDFHLIDSLILAAWLLNPVICLIATIGVLSLKRWGRWVSIIYLFAFGATLLWIAYQLLAELSDHPEWTTDNIMHACWYVVWCLLCLGVAAYLTRPSVKGQFQSKKRDIS